MTIRLDQAFGAEVDADDVSDVDAVLIDVVFQTVPGARRKARQPAF